MKTKTHLLCLLLLSISVKYSRAETLRKAYLDSKNNIHLITMQGRHKQITHNGNITSFKIAPNNETIAWLVANTWTAEGDDKPGSEELVIYRDGKSASIKCSPFIRHYWFWQNGAQVAIDCGGRRFAGREILYDSKTLKEIASFDQGDVPLEKRPDWSAGGN